MNRLLTTLAVLTHAERARVLAHVAALVAMPLKRRNAILRLTDAIE